MSTETLLDEFIAGDASNTEGVFVSAAQQPTLFKSIGTFTIDPADRITPPDTGFAFLGDFGDAPDTGVGTGAGNYQTTLVDNGPRHGATFDLTLGFDIDNDNGHRQSADADADDAADNRDDEDGVINPLDLRSAIGALPEVELEVFNFIGDDATLYGWIDYNADGVFDNATERASVSVPNGTNGNAVLTFPRVPEGFVGTTYARFRLSTDLRRR